jgi:hypothetical protein
MPVSMMEAGKLQTQRINIEMKDSRVFAAVEAQLGSKEKRPDLAVQNTSQPTVNKTVKILFKTDSKVPGERSVAVIPSSKEKHKPPGRQLVPPEESIFTVSQSSGPESVAESQAEETAPTATESDETPTMLAATRIEDLGDRDDARIETSETSEEASTYGLLTCSGTMKSKQMKTSNYGGLQWGSRISWFLGLPTSTFEERRWNATKLRRQKASIGTPRGGLQKAMMITMTITSTKGLM